MKPAAIALFLSTLLGYATAIAQPVAPVTQPADELPAFMKEPGWVGHGYFGQGQYAKLDALVADFTKSKTRAEDGRFSLFLLTWHLHNWFEQWGAESDAQMTGRLQSWSKQFPDSAMQPIVAAMQMHVTAWRARGNGFSSTVTEEGWRLFKERNQRAWQILIDHKEVSSSLPAWYEKAIRIGSDAGLPGEVLRELFDEGMSRHPGYHPIYFAYVRELAPRWGGSYAEADTFIREQTAAKAVPDGDELYARMYWTLDQIEQGPPSFFQESKVSWPRMRKGFERMMRAYPKSARNRANFAVFACRAHDGNTYGILRPKIDPGEFNQAAPTGISLEVCDARFMKTT
jgi:hypothetical protein